MKAETRFIFVTGGVVSSLGKGLIAASIGSLLQARGYKIRIRKFDPYLNIDSGTMSPFEHGEVFVTEDGSETDLDLGSYERFTGIKTDHTDSITSGKVYRDLLARERSGDYLGNTIQVIPHVTNIIREFISRGTSDLDFILCEIGGTVGDIEALPFLESIRQFRYELGPQRTFFVHVTLLPYLCTSKELKTKPTQHSVKELRSIGIQPDMIVCRSDRKVAPEHLNKIANFSNLDVKAVIPALNVDNVYRLPIEYHNSGMDKIILQHFDMDSRVTDLSKWHNILYEMDNPVCKVEIAIVGKYAGLSDAYKSLIEAIMHGGLPRRIQVIVRILDARKLNEHNIEEHLSGFDGVVVAGGFGVDGIEGKIAAIHFARVNNIPFLGICMGMQLAIIEFARNCAGLKEATSSEFLPKSELSQNMSHCFISMASEWIKDGNIVKPQVGVMGGNMRLGGYKAKLKEGSRIYAIYNKQEIFERHRHRYEVNPSCISTLERAGLAFSGFSVDGDLVEIIELPQHKWFVGVQFHPELSSAPMNPHPLFVSFVEISALQANIFITKNIDLHL